MSDLTLSDYAMQYSGLRCRWDGAKLTGIIDCYNHEDGSPVSGFEMPQWISMACTKCGYAWSLRKVPILKHHTTRLSAATL